MTRMACRAQVEVLCSRVGIMAAGRLACLGSSQRLKSLYGGESPGIVPS